MKKIIKKILIGLTVILILIPFSNTSQRVNAAKSDGYINLAATDSKDKVDVFYVNGNKQTSLIKHPILSVEQLSQEERSLLSISDNAADGINKIKDYITSSTGMIKNLKVSSINNDVSIKSVQAVFSDDDMKSIAFVNKFNLQILVRLSNWEELTFSIPVTFLRPNTNNDSAPTVQFDPVFMLRPTISASSQGYSLVNGIVASYLNKDSSVLIPSDQWKITSVNGVIKNDNVLDVSKPGIFQVDYEITNPNSGQAAKITRKITVVDESKDKDDYTPMYQATLYPVNKVGYINYVLGYGVMLYDDFGDEAKPLNRYLLHGSSWKVLNSVLDEHGEEWYSLGKDQWVKQKYVTFNKNSIIQSVNFVAQITSEEGSKLYNGYGDLAVFSGRILSKNSKWKVKSTVLSGDVLWYNLGGDQWIKAEDAQ